MLSQTATAGEVVGWHQLERGATSKAPLHPEPNGLALLHERLREANSANPQFGTQYLRLSEVLQTVLLRLEEGYGDHIERVMAVGEWAEAGIDLRNLPYDEVVVEIVVRTGDLPFTLYWQLAETVFADLHDEDALYYDAARDRLPQQAFGTSYASGLLRAMRRFAREVRN